MGNGMFDTNGTFKEKDIDGATMFYPAWCQFRICKFTVQDFEESYCVEISFLGHISLKVTSNEMQGHF